MCQTTTKTKLTWRKLPQLFKGGRAKDGIVSIVTLLWYISHWKLLFLIRHFETPKVNFAQNNWTFVQRSDKNKYQCYEHRNFGIFHLLMEMVACHKTLWNRKSEVSFNDLTFMHRSTKKLSGSIRSIVTSMFDISYWKFVFS